LGEMDELDLTDFFKTKSQAIDFSSRVTTVLEDIYHTDFSIEKSLTQQFGIQKKDIFIRLLRENNVDVGSTPMLQEFLKKIQEKISSLAVMSLTLAFEPTDLSLKAIAQWFLMNIHQQVLLEFVVDPGIIAGIHITYNGKFKDYSIKTAFDQILKNYLQHQTQGFASPSQAATEDGQNTEFISFGR